MNKRTGPTGAALAAGAALLALLLTGCDADGDGLDDETGQPVASAPTAQEAGPVSDCDPNGFGPLSGCGPTQDELDDIADRFPKGTASDLSACKHEQRADADNVTPECAAQLDAWADQFERDAKDAFALGTAAPGTDWVVESVQDRDGNYVAVCVAAGDLPSDPNVESNRFWKEVDLSQAAAGSLHRGDACPLGGTIFDDGPIRPDGAS